MVVVSGLAQSDDVLRVRWGGEQSAVMRVIGVDAENRLRLAAIDGAQGEALIPLTEAADLQFILPEVYREAQQRVFVGRPAEAVFLLREVMPAYVPYAHIPGSNSGAAVRFYLNLLIDQREWVEALAIAAGLVEQTVSDRFVPDLVRLVRSLQLESRFDDAAWLVGRLPIGDVGGANHVLIVGVADEMRRAGHWVEAQSIYQRLREPASTEEVARWDWLIAYTDWHQGSALRAGVAVAAVEDLIPTSQAGLVGLLMGRVALANGELTTALDVLGETLIGVDAASEWRIEITALIAEAYRAQGDEVLAKTIESDLQRMHPQSRWVISP